MQYLLNVFTLIDLSDFVFIGMDKYVSLLIIESTEVNICQLSRNSIA